MGETVTVDAKCQYSHPARPTDRRMAAVLWGKKSTRFAPAAVTVAAALARRVKQRCGAVRRRWGFTVNISCTNYTPSSPPTEPKISRWLARSLALPFSDRTDAVETGEARGKEDGSVGRVIQARPASPRVQFFAAGTPIPVATCETDN